MNQYYNHIVRLLRCNFVALCLCAGLCAEAQQSFYSNQLRTLAAALPTSCLSLNADTVVHAPMPVAFCFDRNGVVDHVGWRFLPALDSASARHLALRFAERELLDIALNKDIAGVEWRYNTLKIRLLLDGSPIAPSSLRPRLGQLLENCQGYSLDMDDERFSLRILLASRRSLTLSFPREADVVLGLDSKELGQRIAAQLSAMALAEDVTDSVFYDAAALTATPGGDSIALPDSLTAPFADTLDAVAVGGFTPGPNLLRRIEMMFSRMRNSHPDTTIAPSPTLPADSAAKMDTTVREERPVIGHLAATATTTPRATQGEIFLEPGDEFYIQQINNNRYYVYQDSAFYLVFDSAYLSESFCNIMLNPGERAYHYSVKQPLYGFRSREYGMESRAFDAYFAEGYVRYFGIEKVTPELLQGYLVLFDTDLRCIHLAQVSTTPEALLGGGEMKLRLVPYIPQHNIKSLFNL